MTPLRVVKSGLCVGCGSCVFLGHASEASMKFDQYGQLRPCGTDVAKDAFARTCPFSNRAANEDEIASELYPEQPQDPHLGRFVSAYVGSVAEAGFRDRGSSGGMVTWVLAELFRRGMIDGAAHVVQPEDAREAGCFFGYRISRRLEDIERGSKSRYYPVEMSQVLAEIREVPGRYAVVGVPCFIKAVNLLRREDPLIAERIQFTLGLFCGHMKSARLIESFAWQMDSTLAPVKRAEHRIKDPSRPASTYTSEIELANGEVRRRDWWNMPDGDWGSGFFQYEACNFCDDVVAETADISFGDAWVEPYSSDGRGTNVVVTRSRALDVLVQEGMSGGQLSLEPVDSEFVVQTQAAGFRQRREGLAYRLTWRLGNSLRKRVSPSANLPLRRKWIYRCRAHISRWSHRVFSFARAVHQPRLYLAWAHAVVRIYHALAYGRGKLGAWVERIAPMPDR